MVKRFVKGGSRFNKGEFESQVIAHAWKDKEFRKRLLANPKAALKELGYDVPPNVNIKVKEEEAHTLTLMLPPSPAHVEQLSENELRRVAAAGNPNITSVLCR